jgi:hypothetical protein
MSTPSRPRNVDAVVVGAGPVGLVGGYDAVIVDPKGIVAQRYGLKRGGRVVIRPDGYIGTIATLDDHAGVANYFAQITR